MIVDDRAAILLRALANRCRAAAAVASDDETFQKFMRLAADLDAGAAKTARTPEQWNGAA